MNINADARVAFVVRYFESLTEDRLAALSSVYAPDASFKDPFNEVCGLDAIRGVYAHMFKALAEPRFVIRQAVADGDQAFLIWDFSFSRRGSGTVMCVRGATHLSFQLDGRIAVHRDYWDTAEELYAKLPVLGAVVRWLTRQFSTPH